MTFLQPEGVIGYIITCIKTETTLTTTYVIQQAEWLPKTVYDYNYITTHDTLPMNVLHFRKNCLAASAASEPLNFTVDKELYILYFNSIYFISFHWQLLTFVQQTSEENVSHLWTKQEYSNWK